MRMLFTKEGVAIWSSHLDLMRALMRSFRRAGIELKHSQGFTPHPELSILMPLSVGVESQCEIAEFTLAEGCTVPVSEIVPRLNPVLPAGIRALDCWEGGMKAGKLAWLRARLTLAYEGSGIRDQGSGDGGNEDSTRSGEHCSPQIHRPPEATGQGSGVRDQGSGDGGTDSSAPLRDPQNDKIETGSVVGGGIQDAPPVPACRDGSQPSAAPDFDEATGNRQQATGDGGTDCHDQSADWSRNDRIAALRSLFARPSLVVEKHGKKGPVKTDIAPMIRELTVSAVGAVIGRPEEGSGSGGTDPSTPLRSAQDDKTGGDAVVVEAVVAAQNPTLNPMLLVTAIETYLPEYKPAQVRCRRIEIYDAEGKPFR